MHERRVVPAAVQIFLYISLLLNAFAVGCEGYARHRHMGWPYDTPGLGESPIPDLANYVAPFAHLHTPAFFDLSYPVPYMYPAPVALLYSVCLPLAHHPHQFVGLLLLLAMTVAAAFAWRLARTGLGLGRSGLIAAGAVVLSYPLFLEVKQGNTEIFVCVLVGAGVWCFVRERWHAAAMFIGIAGAMKLFPFVYLGLFLAQRHYRPLLTAFGTAIILTLISLRYLDPSIAVSWHGVATDLAYYQRTVALPIRREIGFDHTLFALVKLGLRHWNHFATAQVAEWLRGYLALAAVGGVVLFFTRIRLLPLINQVLCLCVASILLPPVSYDYTLLHLYIPWGLLVFFAVREQGLRTPGLREVFVCFAVLMSIESELILHAKTMGGQLKALTLIVLMVVALLFPFSDDMGNRLDDRVGTA